MLTLPAVWQHVGRHHPQGVHARGAAITAWERIDAFRYGRLLKRVEAVPISW